MLVRRVVQHKLGDDSNAAPMGFPKERFEIVQRAVGRMDVHVVRDVVPVVLQGRRIKRKKPDCGDAEVLKIIELLSQSCEIADPVVIAVEECADVQFINDRVLVPERIVFKCETFSRFGH